VKTRPRMEKKGEKNCHEWVCFGIAAT